MENKNNFSSVADLVSWYTVQAHVDWKRHAQSFRLDLVKFEEKKCRKQVTTLSCQDTWIVDARSAEQRLDSCSRIWAQNLEIMSTIPIHITYICVNIYYRGGTGVIQ